MIDLTRISTKELEATLRRGVTLVDFNAPWCGPCRAQEPVIEELERDYDGRATIASVNIDENQKVAMHLGIQSIPTLILYREGREIGRFIGLQDKKTLSQAIGEAITRQEPEAGSQKKTPSELFG
jgi:thioredoxin 1